MAGPWYIVSGITLNAATGAEVAFAVQGGNTPSDTNGGLSRLDPYLTLQKALNVAEAAGGGTIYFEGLFRVADATAYQATKTDSAGNITFAQTPGGNPAEVRGFNKAGSATGWSSSGNGYQKNIGAGLSISTVVWDYDAPANIDSVGRHKSFLVAAASAAAALAAGGTAVGGWFYAAGVLSIGIPAGQTAAFDGGAGSLTGSANSCEYSVKARTGIGFVASGTDDLRLPNITVSGITFTGYTDATAAAPLGCCVFYQNGDGCLTIGCHFYDSGIHSISHGSRTTNNVVHGNTHVGQMTGGIFEVFNPTGSTGGVSNKATGCRSNWPVYYGNTLLAHDGSYISAGTSAAGFICHGVTARCTDVEVWNPQFVGHTPISGTPCTSVPYTFADGPVPSDTLNPETYGVRLRQTAPNLFAVSNATGWPDQGMVSNAACIGARLDFAQFRSVNVLGCIDLTSVTGTLGFFACEITATTSNPAGGTYVFKEGAAGQFVCVNTAVYDNSTLAQHSGAQAYAMVSLVTGASVFDGCIFGFRDSAGAGTRGLCQGDGAITGANHHFTGCLYWSIGTGLYSANASYDTAAEWFASIDTTGTAVAALPFGDITGAGLGLTLTEQLRKQIIATHAVRGSNGLPYAGNAGPRQYGAGRGVRRRLTAASRRGVGGPR